MSRMILGLVGAACSLVFSGLALALPASWAFALAVPFTVGFLLLLSTYDQKRGGDGPPNA